MHIVLSNQSRFEKVLKVFVPIFTLLFVIGNITYYQFTDKYWPNWLYNFMSKLVHMIG